MMTEVTHTRALQNKDRLAERTGDRSSVIEGPPPQMWILINDRNWVLYFERDKYDLIKDHPTVLGHIRKMLDDDEQLMMEIYGHASTEGDMINNKVLAENRCEAVVNFLFKDKLEAIERATWAGKGISEAGSEKGATKEEAEKRRGLNRRVTIALIDSPKWRVKWLILRRKANDGLERLKKKYDDFQRLEVRLNNEMTNADINDFGGAALGEVIKTIEDLRGQILFWKPVVDKLDELMNQKGWEDYKVWFQTEYGGVKKLYENSIASSQRALNQAQNQLNKYLVADPQDQDRIKFWERVVEDCQDTLKEVTDAMKYALQEM